MASNSRPRMSVRTDSCVKLLQSIWLKEAKSKNFAFSPLSIYVALSLLASGSDGETLEQLLGFLGCKTRRILNKVISKLMNSIAEFDSSRRDGAGPKLSLVNGLWVDSGRTLITSFKEIASSIYRAKAESVDFETKGDKMIKKVNKWVEKETNGLIKDLLRSLDGLVLLLVNALYFKGSWEKDQFNPSLTSDSKFYLLDGSSFLVPFMTTYDDSQYVSCYKGFKVLQLPYKGAASDDGRCFSMYIFLPNKKTGLPELVKKANSDSGFLDRHLPTQRFTVGMFKIPKFKISFGFEASLVLIQAGLDLPFDSEKADLTEMLESGNLYVSGAYHKCVVEVDEEGTEAAAATAFDCSADICDDYEPVDFVADHPFMFIIRDNHNGVVWFMGLVLNPSLDTE